jgi:hypothetical protein
MDDPADKLLLLKLANFLVHKRLLSERDAAMTQSANECFRMLRMRKSRFARGGGFSPSRALGARTDAGPVGRDPGTGSGGTAERPDLDEVVARLNFDQARSHVSTLIRFQGLGDLAPGSILASPHVGPFVSAILALEGSVRCGTLAVLFESGAANPRNVAWERLFSQSDGAIQSFSTDFVGVRASLNHLEAGGILCIMPDIYEPSSTGVFVEVSGRMWLMSPAISWLAGHRPGRLCLSVLTRDASGKYLANIKTVREPEVDHICGESVNYLRIIEMMILMGREIEASELPWSYRDLWKGLPLVPDMPIKSDIFMDHVRDLVAFSM